MNPLALFRGVTFRTNFSPDYTYTPSSGQTSGGNPLSDIFMRLAQPSVEAETAAGRVVLYQPYGEPTENYLVPLALLVGAIGLTSYVIAKKVICR